jgi:CubicO group peptidase (beta-lactamase class C family)
MTISVAMAEAGRVVRDDGADALVPWWSFTKALIAAAALALVRDRVWRLLSLDAAVAVLVYGHFTSGGIDDRIESTLPPVFSPKVVPRS